MTVKWEDPPTSVRDRWKVVVDELKAHPGRWARVFEPAPTPQATEALKAMKRHGCEAVMRKMETVGTGVWARWPEAGT